MPNPFDAPNGLNVIRYLNAALITIAYNKHTAKYGSIREAWEDTREAFKQDLAANYQLLTLDQKESLNAIIQPKDLIIMSVWNG